MEISKQSTHSEVPEKNLTEESSAKIVSGNSSSGRVTGSNDGPA